MKFAAAAAVLFAGLAAAVPATKAPRDTWVTLDFWAAADNTFSKGFPVDNKWHDVNDPYRLSFTSISSNAPDNIECIVSGIDGSSTILQGAAQDVPIGPPQVQTQVTCFQYKA